MALVGGCHGSAAALLPRPARRRPARAGIELFSSKRKTTAFSGGFSYRPIPSGSFSSKRGSRLPLKVRTKCGFRPHECLTRCPKRWEVPAARPSSGQTRAGPPVPRSA